MSQRLIDLRASLDRQTGIEADTDCLKFLNRKSFRGGGVPRPADWSRLLNRLARHAASTRGISLREAWFHVASTLATAIPDPKDNLYGIRLAAFANGIGVDYPDAETYARLFAGYARVYHEWDGSDATDNPGADALRFFDFVGNRLQDLSVALDGALENDELVSEDLYANPDDAVAATVLLWDAITDHARFHEAHKLGKMGEDEVDAYVGYGGHHLWGCHHARLHDVERDELMRFVCSYPQNWFRLMDALLERDLLAPGVLDALVETSGSVENVVECGIELVAEHRSSSIDMPLTEYLDVAFSAQAQDA